MLAFTFPGQGSQRPGMGRPWRHHESWELVTEASDVCGKDVGHLLLDADAEVLRDTRNAQLTTYVASLMVLDAVERLGLEPSCFAGHSLGEYTALTASGSLGFDDGVRLVVERAEAMHEAGAAAPGVMSAVLGLDDDQVEVACRLADMDVWVANFNAPGQVVIAGAPDAVSTASEIAKELGADFVLYQSIEQMEDAVQSVGPERQFCKACFEGKYPTGDITERMLNDIEQDRLEASKA